MYAVRMHRYGSPEVLRYEECDPPHPRPAQIVVSVEATGVNPIDWHIRSGLDCTRVTRRLPAVLGLDFAGRVLSLGAGVLTYLPGDRVFGQCELSEDGSYAEVVRVYATRVARYPPSLGSVRAASLPTMSLAAWQALFEFGELQAGQKVLIAGIAGNVGRMAAQLCKRVPGVEVIGVCRRAARNEELYRICPTLIEVDKPNSIAGSLGRFDLVLNLMGPCFERRAIAATRRGGRMVTSSTMPDFASYAMHGIRGVCLRGRFVREHLEAVAHLVARGEIRLPTLHIEHLSSAAKIHVLAESRTLNGKAVLVPG